MNRNEETFYPLGFMCCFPNGPLSLEATTPVSGYCPGQTCIVKVKVSNESKQTLRKMQVQLYKVREIHNNLDFIKWRNYYLYNFVANHIFRQRNA